MNAEDVAPSTAARLACLDILAVATKQVDFLTSYYPNTHAHTARGAVKAFSRIASLARRGAGLPDPGTEPEAFTCPRCGRTSYHPKDIAEGYCGHCHEWNQPNEH
jgi:hypothetical protein